MKKFLLIVVCLFLWGVVYKVFTDSSVVSGATPAADLRPALELLSKDATTERNTLYVTGKVRNNSESNYRYVQISFDIYNAAHEKCGTAWTNVAGLSRDEIWAFKGTGYCESAPAQYKLASLTGR